MTPFGKQQDPLKLSLDAPGHCFGPSPPPRGLRVFCLPCAARAVFLCVISKRNGASYRLRCARHQSGWLEAYRGDSYFKELIMA